MKKRVTFFSDTLKWKRVVIALILMTLASVVAGAQPNKGDYTALGSAAV